MGRVLLVLPALAAASVLAAGCGSSGSSSAADTESATTTSSGGAASGTLPGSVGPGFDISMGQSTVAPGTYELTVDDQASIHDFHLTGPGDVDVSTDVSGTGTTTFTVTLQKGTYTFVCDPHSSQMHGTLTVS
jgi:plastocyanin